MATDHDARALAQFVGSRPKYPYGAGSLGVINLRVDMAAVAAGLGAVIDGSASDTLKIWTIPALTHVISCAVYLHQAEGAASTITLGDSAAVDNWLASFSLNGAVGTHKMTLITDANGLTFGKTYTDADYLKLTFGTAADIDLAIFDVSAFCIFYEFPELAPSVWH